MATRTCTREPIRLSAGRRTQPIDKAGHRQRMERLQLTVRLVALPEAQLAVTGARDDHI